MRTAFRKYLVTVALVWIACSVLFGFAYMLILAPQNNNRHKIEQKLEDQKDLFEKALQASKKGNHDLLNEQIKTLKVKLSDFVSDNEGTAGLTFDISRITKEQEVKAVNIKSRDIFKTSKISDCTHIYENRIDLEFKAGFEQFASLINALERHRPVIFVETFKISRSKNSDLDHLVNMNLAALARNKQRS